MADPQSPQTPVLTHLGRTRNRVDSLLSEMRAANRRLNGSHPVPMNGEATAKAPDREVSANDLMRETDVILEELEKTTQLVIGTIGFQPHEHPQTPDVGAARSR